jgi:gluconolactonase
MFDPDGDRYIARLEVLNEGQSLSSPTLFARVTPGFADGLRCDEDGNVWTSAADGVHCLDRAGMVLGVINTPSLVSNLCFGGRKRNRLFLCASQTLYALFVNTRGAR